LREGLIYRNNTNERISFKVISNNYLLKQKWNPVFHLNIF
jgi:hypothetical protein